MYCLLLFVFSECIFSLTQKLRCIALHCCPAEGSLHVEILHVISLKEEMQESLFQIMTSLHDVHTKRQNNQLSNQWFGVKWWAGFSTTDGGADGSHDRWPFTLKLLPGNKINSYHDPAPGWPDSWLHFSFWYGRWPLPLVLIHEN